MNGYDWLIWLTGVVVGASASIFLFIWMPVQIIKTVRRQKQEREIKRNQEESRYWSSVQRMNHRHLFILQPASIHHKTLLHWKCYDCPEPIPAEVYWDRECYKEETLKGYSRPKDNLAGWAG